MDFQKELFSAAFNDNLERLKSLLEQGASIDQKNERGENLLHSAARYGSLRCVQFLIAEGININEKSNDRMQTPLHQSAMSGQLKCVDYLIKQGADVHEKSVDGWTSLHWAAWEGDFRCLKLLIEQHAGDIARQDSNGKTPLDTARDSLEEHEHSEPELAENLKIAINYLVAKAEQVSLHGVISSNNDHVDSLKF